MASGKKKEGSPADAAPPAAGVCSSGSSHHPCRHPVGTLSPPNSFTSPVAASASHSSCDRAQLLSSLGTSSVAAVNHPPCQTPCKKMTRTHNAECLLPPGT